MRSFSTTLFIHWLALFIAFRGQSHVAAGHADGHGGNPRLIRRPHQRALITERQTDDEWLSPGATVLVKRDETSTLVATATSTSLIQTTSTAVTSADCTSTINTAETDTTTIQNTYTSTQVNTISSTSTVQATVTQTRASSTVVKTGPTTTVTVTAASKQRREPQLEDLRQSGQQRSIHKRDAVTTTATLTTTSTQNVGATSTQLVTTYVTATQTTFATASVVTSTTATSQYTNTVFLTAQSTTTVLANQITVTQYPTATTTVCPPASIGTGSCAAVYTACSGLGHVPTISGTGTLPKPSTFVKRNPSTGKLTLGGKPYKIVGPNIYWLGIGDDASNSSNVIVPSRQRIREAMAIAVAMGANTIRSTTLGVSTGHPYTLEPSGGHFNAKAWQSIDYAVFAAKQYGLRLIIPFTDSYKYYHGGLYNFVEFAGYSTTASNYSQTFYTNRTVINLFKQYIRYYLLHVNQFTGIPNWKEPTIMMWETGNELGMYMLKAGAPPAPWTNEISTWIKSIAPHQLVMDGTNGLYDINGQFRATGFNLTNVDVLTNHYYPPGGYLLNKDAPVASAYRKAYLIGEYDWTDQNNPTSPISSFLPMLEKSSAAGDMLWSVYGHDDNCCQFMQHNDGFSLYYPNGNQGPLQSNILLIVQHWYRQTGRKPPVALPGVVCRQPAF